MSDESIAEASDGLKSAAAGMGGATFHTPTGSVTITADGSVEANDDTEGEHADPFWGDVLDDEAAMVEQPISDTERDELVATASQHSRQAAAFERRADAYRFEAKAASKASKEAATVGAEHRAKSDAALHAADTAMQARETMCPVRLRDIDGERIVVVLHPETGAVIEEREYTDDDRHLKITGADEAEGIDRVQIRARLMLLEDALSISRGSHAVPPQSEIEAWPTGVCVATQAWLDSIDRGDDDLLRPLPVWVTGVRGVFQDSYRSHTEQITSEFGALALGQIFDTVDDTTVGARVRLDLPGLVATLKRQQVIGGTSQHLTAVLKVAADFGGVPQLKTAVADAEGALLRQLHYIVKCKPAPDGVADEDVRATVLVAIERTLGVAS